jgi:hypothetical protein
MNTVKSFLKTHKRVYMPHLIKEYGFSTGIYKELYDYPIRFVNGMFMLEYNDPELYVEAGPKYVRGRTVPINELDRVIYHADGAVDMHFGVFAHDRSWVDNVRKTGSVSGGGKIVRAPVLWMDFDREDPKEAEADAWHIIHTRKLKKSEFALYISGNKGVHLAINMGLFAHPTGDQNIMCGRGKFFYNLAHTFAQKSFDYNVDVYMMDKKEIIKLTGIKDADKARKRLEVIDPNLYGVNSTIRIPGSVHEKTGRTKELVGGTKYLELIETPLKPRFIDLCDKAYRVKPKPRSYEYDGKLEADDNTIDELYLSMFGEEYDPSSADSNGYVGPFLNPFYNDTIPGLYINIQTGHFHDFGNVTDYSFPFHKAYALWHKITEREAVRNIRERRGCD